MASQRAKLPGNPLTFANPVKHQQTSTLRPRGQRQIKDLQDLFNLIMVNVLRKGDVLVVCRCLQE